VHFPVDVCQLKDSDKVQCEGCNGKGRSQLHRSCGACGGTGNQRGVAPLACYRCQGSGWLNRYRGVQCHECLGKGKKWPSCRACYGRGQVVLREKQCEKCSGTGAFPLSRALALHATAAYVRWIAEVMEACLEDDEPFLNDRGEQLYLMLKAIHSYTKQDCGQRLPVLFPAEMAVVIKQSRQRIRTKSPATRKKNAE
jgi:hypothetical protein